MVLATVSADTLRGHATGLWDVGPAFETDEGAVTAVRIPCSAVPSTAASGRAASGDHLP
jgi:hypothetical protein